MFGCSHQQRRCRRLSFFFKYSSSIHIRTYTTTTLYPIQHLDGDYHALHEDYFSYSSSTPCCCICIHNNNTYTHHTVSPSPLTVMLLLLPPPPAAVYYSTFLPGNNNNNNNNNRMRMRKTPRAVVRLEGQYHPYTLYPSLNLTDSRIPTTSIYNKPHSYTHNQHHHTPISHPVSASVPSSTRPPRAHSIIQSFVRSFIIDNT